MLSFAAILPHPPVLIPSIGKDNTEKLIKTQNALDILESEFRQKQIDTVIIISPHGDLYPDAFTINTLPDYEANFEQFGDFETKLKFQGDLEFINRFKEQVESKMDVILKSMAVLDHGTAIPLYCLSQQYKNFKIVPINYSLLSYEKHIEFGEQLKELIINEDKKIAVIASADLSHRLAKDAPAGFSPNAKNFDKELIQLLKQKKTGGILNMDKNLIEEAGECGLRSILIMLGIIKDMNYDFQVLSYEAPFGVGYLVGEFKLA